MVLWPVFVPADNVSKIVACDNMFSDFISRLFWRASTASGLLDFGLVYLERREVFVESLGSSRLVNDDGRQCFIALDEELA